MLKKYFVYAFIVLIAFSCDSTSDKVSDDNVSVLSVVTKDDISQINAPKEEHGYQFIENTVITSLDELNLFIDEINDQEFWNHKADFISALQSEEVDFSIYNIIMYSHAEGSGSISVAAHDPVWEEESILIYLDRNVPEIGTCDIAYYLLVYKINKQVDKIIFQVNDKRIEIENRNR